MEWRGVFGRRETRERENEQNGERGVDGWRGREKKTKGHKERRERGVGGETSFSRKREDSGCVFLGGGTLHASARGLAGGVCEVFFFHPSALRVGR
jgi:hypothetical protein